MNGTRAFFEEGSHPPHCQRSAGCSGSDVHGSTPGGAGIGDFSQWLARRWATKKQGGSTKNKKDSKPKYLGTKMSDGALAFPGQLLVKQLGTRFMPGHNVGMVRQHQRCQRAMIRVAC
jgi:ribosomal protein L27